MTSRPLRKKHLWFRFCHGSSLIELVLGLIALIPVVLVIFDLSVIAIAVQVNDSTCREAARAAATGNPLDAQTRAQTIINRANTNQSMLCSNFMLVSALSTVTPQDIAALGTFGGPVTGTVTVKTDVQVRPFIVQYAFTGKSPLHFQSQQSFPFTFQVPNTSTSSCLPLRKHAG